MFLVAQVKVISTYHLPVIYMEFAVPTVEYLNIPCAISLILVKIFVPAKLHGSHQEEITIV